MTSSSLSSPVLTYAVHRLVDASGFLCSGMAIINLHHSSHQIIDWQPFDGVERPRTQWLGGTVILSHYRHLPSILSTIRQHSLQEWTDCLSCQASSPTLPLYAWHIPHTEWTVMSPTPIRL
ncbi:MAG: hypothetical protein IJX44_09560 [Bacteroidaceae bacterium]|nr:hypothetical protein [Bacteroidaceae bacterium]